MSLEKMSLENRSLENRSLETCEPFRELLSDLADGDIEGPEASAVEGHVAGCAACRADLALLRGVVMNLTRVGEEEVPRELISRVMAQVNQPTWSERAIALLLGVFTPGTFRVAVPVAAMLLLALAIRSFLPSANPPLGSEQFATVPRWFGGPLLVNEMPHAVNQSGKLALRPGDSLRTADKVEVSLYLNEAQVEMHPKTSIIMKRDGLYLAEGEIVVRVPEGASLRGEEQAMKIATQNAIIVHIGTVFRTSFDHGVTNTEVSQGLVKVYSTTGASQEIGAGQHALVDAGGIVTGPAVEPPRDLRPARSAPEEIRSISQSLPGGPAK